MANTRPWSIMAFEIVAVVTVVAKLILDRNPVQPLRFDLLGDVVVPTLMLWLIVRISRRRSPLARSAYTALWAVLMGLVGWLVFTGASRTGSGEVALEPLFALLFAVQLVLLWLPSSSAWLPSGPAANAAAR